MSDEVKVGKMERPEDAGCYVSYRVSCWGGKAKTGQDQLKDQEESGVNPEWLDVRKQLIDRSMIKKIESILSAGRSYIKRESKIKTQMEGVDFLVTPKISKVNSYLKGLKSQVQVLVDEFVEKYEELRAAAQQELGPEYNPRKYPSKEEMRNRFKMEWSFLSLSAPTQSSLVDPEIYEEAQREYKKSLDYIRTSAVGYLREEFQGLVNHLIERLTPAGDGEKKKVFRDSVITNIQEWMDEFNQFNTIARDSDLSALVEKAKAIVAGKTAGSVREAQEDRDSIREAFRSVKEKLDPLVEEAPSRVFSFDD